MFQVIDSWFAGASAYRRIEYRVVFDRVEMDYRLEYRTDGGEWDEVGKNREGHRVAKGIAFMVILEDQRQGIKEKERKLA